MTTPTKFSIKRKPRLLEYFEAPARFLTAEIVEDIVEKEVPAYLKTVEICEDALGSYGSDNFIESYLNISYEKFQIELPQLKDGIEALMKQIEGLKTQRDQVYKNLQSLNQEFETYKKNKDRRQHIMDLQADASKKMKSLIKQIKSSYVRLDEMKLYKKAIYGLHSWFKDHDEWSQESWGRFIDSIWSNDQELVRISNKLVEDIKSGTHKVVSSSLDSFYGALNSRLTLWLGSDEDVPQESLGFIIFWRRLVGKTIAHLLRQKAQSFLQGILETYPTRDRLLRKFRKMERLQKLYLSTPSAVGKRQWLSAYRSSAQNYISSLQELLKEPEEGEEPVDQVGLMQTLTQDVITDLSQSISDFIKSQVQQPVDSYQQMRAFSIKLYETSDDRRLAVKFSETTQGRMLTGAMPIGKILENAQVAGKNFARDLVVWDFDRSELSPHLKDSPQVWQIVATVARAEGLVPVANNGSRMFIRALDEQGNLTPVAQLMDALFDDFSQIGAYGLSHLNSSPESQINGPHSEPINGDWVDEQGRKCVAIIYDSKALGWCPGTDGGSVSSVGLSFQHRSFIFDTEGDVIIPLERKKVKNGAFFKGLVCDGRVTMVDGKPWSVKDTLNLSKLSDDEFKKIFGIDKTEESIAIVKAKGGHYEFEGRSLRKERQYRIDTWDEWFENHKALPRVYGMEVGMLKGVGKTSLAKLDRTLIDKTYKDRNGIEKTLTENSKVGDILKACNGCLVIKGDIYGWSIIDAPETSKTSLNYQPQSALIYTAEALVRLKSGYKTATDLFVDQFKTSSMDPDKLDRLRNLVCWSLRSESIPELEEWAQVVLKNPLGSMNRWIFNYDRTIQNTKRVIMVDHGETAYTGFMLVEGNDEVRFNLVKNEDTGEMEYRLVRCATWRGPLLVSSALQAPWAISGEVACELLQAHRRCLEEEEITPSQREDLDRVVDRLIFARDKDETKERILELLPQILQNIINDSMLLKLGKEVVVMDVKDVERMQGDDDGDTVVIEFHVETVERFVQTEIFWAEFYKVNKLRPLEIEMNKGNQIQFGLANKIYDEGISYEDLNDKEKSLIDIFGISIKDVSDHYQVGAEKHKIPSPLGLNFKLIKKIEDETRGEGEREGFFFKNLTQFGFKLGSTPTGPIGAFSNVAPDLMIRALRETDGNLKLTPYGQHLWQGYSTCASGVQVSIDWAKRVYNIINIALFDKQEDDGKYSIDFERELTPELINPVAVKNTFKEVFIVQFKIDELTTERKEGSLRPKKHRGENTYHKVGHKLVRYRVVDKSEVEPKFRQALPLTAFPEYLKSLDTSKIQEVSKVFLDSLGRCSGYLPYSGSETFQFDTKQYYRIGESTKVTQVNLMDEGNGCFDFDSVYAIGSFMIQKPHTGIVTRLAQQAAVWKASPADLLGDRRVRVQEAMGDSYHRSSLHAHLSSFLNYTTENRDFEGMLQVMSNLQAKAADSKAGKVLDPLWNRVRARVAAFFDEKGGGDRGEMKKSGVIRAVLRGFGVPEGSFESLFSQRASFTLEDPNKEKGLDGKVKTHQLDLSDIVGCLFRNDDFHNNPNVPQNLTQMFLSEYLDRSDPNPVQELCDQKLTSIMNHFVEILTKPFKKASGAEFSLRIDTNPGKFITDGRFDWMEGDGYDHLTSWKKNHLVLEDKEKDGQTYQVWRWREGGNYFWHGIADVFEAYYKVAFNHQPKFFSQLERLIKEVMCVYGPLEAQKKALSGVKELSSALVSGVRLFRSYANQTVPVTEVISIDKSGEKRLARFFRPNTAASSGVEDFYSTPEEAWSGLTFNNFFGDCVSRRRIMELIKANKSLALLPPAQDNRNTQEKIIFDLAEQGYLVSSWSFFSDVVWRSKFELQMLKDLQDHKKIFTTEGLRRNQNPPARPNHTAWFRTMSVASLFGKRWAKAEQLFTKDDLLYNAVKRHDIRPFEVGPVGGKFPTLINLHYPSLMNYKGGQNFLYDFIVAENVVLNCIAYLDMQATKSQVPREQEEVYKQSLRTVGIYHSRGGNAWVYEDKEYFNPQGLINRLMKKVRFK